MVLSGAGAGKLGGLSAAASRAPRPEKSGNTLMDGQSEALYATTVEPVDEIVKDTSHVTPLWTKLHKSTGARFGSGLCHSIGLYHCGNGFLTVALFALPVASFSGGLAVSTLATSCFWYGRTQASLCVALSVVVARSLPRPATHTNVALVDITLRTCC